MAPSPLIAALLVTGGLAATVACAEPAPPAPPASPDATAAMAHAHAHDAPTASPAVGRPGGGMEVSTRSVEYATVGGKPVTGALAQPKGAAKGGPAIILIHEWWGLNDNIRDLARQFASHGYTALAVDLYGGKSAQDPAAAQGLMKQAMAHPEAAEDNLKQAYAYLHGKLGAGKVGVIGWCFGGGWSLQLALHAPIDAAVIYYGQLEGDPKVLAGLKGKKVLGIFGTRDKGIPPEAVDAFEAGLKQAGIPAEIHRYDAEHAFANPSNAIYDEKSAADAWEKTRAFLKANL
jgi:carboxymethylenebutenolidase